MAVMSGEESHYEFIERVGEEVKQLLNLQFNPNDLSVSHGDKCYGARSKWQKEGIPFNHGALIYLISYMYPQCTTVRNTDDGWVDPFEWVVKFYNENEELKNLLCSHNIAL